MISRHHFVFSVILIFIAIGFGFMLGHRSSPFPPHHGPHDRGGWGEFRLNDSQKGFTNPLLDCELGSTYLSQNTTRPFQDRIEKEIKTLTSGSGVTYISYYFRDLNNGAWFGFNPDEKFIPASLSKVPLLITALHEEEERIGFLNTKVTYEGGTAASLQYILPANPIVAGKTYTVKELLEHAIIDSDNNAAVLVSELLGERSLNQMFDDVGIAGPDSKEGSVISNRDYSTFFRILFNTSYLSRPLSEGALSLLASAKFSGGLRAGVPDSIAVAHKFGERALADQKQFHDCGIIYYPQKPYLLCIMTRGETYPALIEAIKHLSTVTYQEVASQ
jgi:beta-lactamase class A